MNPLFNTYILSNAQKSLNRCPEYNIRIYKIKSSSKAEILIEAIN